MTADELLKLARFQMLDSRNCNEQAKDKLLGQMADEIERLRGLLDRALISGRLTGHVLASEIRAAIDVPAEPAKCAVCGEQGCHPNEH